MRKSIAIVLVLAVLFSCTALAATTGEQNALKKAGSYLSFTAFSYSGLVDQLEYEGFTTAEATYAADHCGADWNEQAVAKAKSYLSFTSFSTTGLIDQLLYEGFTESQAKYAVENCTSTSTGSGQKDQALKKAQSYLNYSAFSYSGLIDQLEFEGFSTEEATYAADNCGADWNEQAAEKAKSYLSFTSFSRSELINQLKFEGFTTAEAEYGAKANGF